MGLIKGLISAARITLRRVPAPAPTPERAKALALARWAADKNLRGVIHHAGGDVRYPKLRLLPPSSAEDGVDVEIQAVNGGIVQRSKLRIAIVTNDDGATGGTIWKLMGMNASAAVTAALRGAGRSVKEWSDGKIAVARKRLAEIPIKIAEQIVTASTARYSRLLSAEIASCASSKEEQRILNYAIDSKLSPEEFLFQDAKKRRTWRRRDFIQLVARLGVFNTMSNFYIDHINKMSLKANDGRHFEKFIFRSTFAGVEIDLDPTRQKEEDDRNVSSMIDRVRKHLSGVDYLPEGKIDASKCELWCIPISYNRHARVIVINIKEACFEYLDSCRDKRAVFSRIDALCNRIVKPVILYINSMRRDDDKIDFSKFEWKFPPLPRQATGSNACAIYRIRFLEEWNGGGSTDLSKFEGWEERNWHVKERVKLCALILSHDSNAILDEVKQRAQEWQANEERQGKEL